MFNCIESDALFRMCQALGLSMHTIDQHSPIKDVYVVAYGDLGLLNGGCTASAFKLSDYLLAIQEKLVTLAVDGGMF